MPEVGKCSRVSVWVSNLDVRRIAVTIRSCIQEMGRLPEGPQLIVPVLFTKLSRYICISFVLLFY